MPHLKRLNDLALFDPSRWPHRELLARTTGICACLAFIVHRVARFSRYTGDTPPFLERLAGMPVAWECSAAMHLTPADWNWILWFSVWLIETGIFVGYILAFSTRSEARGVARGFMETAFPLLVASIPVLITLFPMNFREVWKPLYPEWEVLFFFFIALVLAGGAINLIGLLTLRRAFTIMSEARVLIRHGIFSFVRHPLYTGHFIMFSGYLMFHLYWYTCALFFLFVLGQYARARIEESKLMGVFPEYGEYMRSTGMFFPRLRLWVRR